MKLKLLRLIKKAVMYLLQFGYRVLCMFIPVSDKKIVFMSFHGRGYGDNPKAIYEEMKKDEKFKDYTFVWVLRNLQETPKGSIGVHYMRWSYFVAMSRGLGDVYKRQIL